MTGMGAVYPNVTSTFEFLANNTFHQLIVDSDYLIKLNGIKRFIVILCDKLSPLDSINKTRMERFCKNNRDMDKLPPTQVTRKLLSISVLFYPFSPFNYL